MPITSNRRWKLRALRMGAILCIVIMSDANAQWGGGGRRGGSNSNQNSDSQSNQQPQFQMSRTAEQTPVVADGLTYEQFEVRLDSFGHDLAPAVSQETAWKQFTDKARVYGNLIAREKAHAQNVKSGASPNLYGLQLLDQLALATKEQSKALEELNGTVKNLYKVLTTEQKAIADKSIGTFLGLKATPLTVGRAAANSVYKGPLTTNSDAKVLTPDFSSSQQPVPGMMSSPNPAGSQ